MSEFQRDEPIAHPPGKPWIAYNAAGDYSTEWVSDIQLMNTNNRWDSKGRRKQYYEKAVEKYGELSQRPQVAFSILSKKEYAMWRDDLSVGEKALLMDLAAYVHAFDCAIAYSNGKPILTAHMAKITKMSISTILKHLASLKQKRIICETETRGKRYYMNPWIIGNGGYVSSCPLSLFQEYQIRSEGGITWREYAKRRGVEW